MVDGARSVLNDLLADVYIFTDHMTGPEAGQSPGYGLMLVAETTTSCFISSECTANAALKVGIIQLSFLFVDKLLCSCHLHCKIYPYYATWYGLLFKIAMMTEGFI